MSFDAYHDYMDNKEGDWDEQLVLFEVPFEMKSVMNLNDEMTKVSEKLGIYSVAMAWECDKCGTVNLDSDLACTNCGRLFKDVPDDGDEVEGE
jgi:hypothetical protein